MKGKLIKTDVNYLLEDNKGVVIGSTSTKEINKLSKQNCDEIFGVVDVEKLAEDFAKYHSIYPTAQDDTEYGFKQGFKKAMELNKDKVFTLEDVRKAYIYGVSNCHSFGYSAIGYTDKCIQSLQQPTEINVEVEMETKKQLVNGYKNQPDNVIGFVADYENILQPKLDSQGCLILKKI